MNRLAPLVVFLCCCFIYAHEAVGQSAIRLEDVTETTGITFRHFSGGTGKHFIVETVTSGLATFDYDDDGLIDIYLLSGAPLQSAKAPPGISCKLYRNQGGFQFVDVTEQAHAGERSFALGVAAGDYDNDGDQDLFVSNFGPNVLLENNGDGTFRRQLIEHAGSNKHVGAGVSLLDIDADGCLDVYLANYIKFSFDKGVNRQIFGIPAAPGPKDYDPDTSILLANEGSGGFRDISESSGIADLAGPGMGTIAFDFDGDRDTDIFVCNDSAANFLFENLGNSQFAEIGLLAGVAYDVTGSQQATMGVDVGDFDNDGLIDIVTTSFIDEMPALYRNSGSGYFDDVAAAVGLGVASRNVTWGVGFADFDSDAWPDLLVASGHLIAGVTRINDAEKFAAPNPIFRNLQGKRFNDVTKDIGTAGAAIQVSRGIALDDFDNDGRTDAVVLNLNDRPQVIRNATENDGTFLQLELIGVESNRDAVGSQVTVHAGGRQWVQQVIAGRGYQSHFGSRLSFGLDKYQRVDAVEVQWHGGETQLFDAVDSGTLVQLREGHPDPIVLRQ